MKLVPRALVVGASETAALLHLPVLARLRDEGKLQLAEICDLRLDSAAAASERFGFSRASGDAAAAIASKDIDLVYLFGGARMHHALGLAALRSGKHLFVEKPVAPSYAEALALADAAQKFGLIAAGGHNRRFLSAFDRIAAEGGGAGWTFAEAVFHKPALGQPPPFDAASWLSGNAIHALDALVFLMGGLPESLTTKLGGSGGVPSVFSAFMRWSSGAQAVFLSNNEAGARREEYCFHAPNETWQVTDRGLTLDRNGVRTELGCSPIGNGFAAEHLAFLNALASGVPPRNAIAALAPSLFLAELIEAGHDGRVRLPSRKTSRNSFADAPTVMLGNAARQRGALGIMPGDWRLVAIEEVDRSSALRPDIKAAILAPGALPLTPEILDKLPQLSIVGVIGLSVARYDPEALLERGITVVNATHAYAQSVAEFALGLAILGRRRAFESSQAMRSGGWGTSAPRGRKIEALLSGARLARRVTRRLGIEKTLERAWRSTPALVALAAPAGEQSRDLSGALVGLIGWGANADAFTRRLIANGARVIVHSDHASPGEIRASGAEPAPLASVLAANIISLHRGLSPSTHHCLGAPELARIQPGAVLINIARGALIDQEALVARLSRGDILALLDTFEEEPLPRAHRLRRMTNVFLTSHIAGGSSDMHWAAAREVIEKVASHLEGRPVATLTAERLATMT